MLSGENSKVCLNLIFFFFQQQQHSDSRVIGVYLLLSTHYPCSDTVAEVRWSFPYTPHLESCVQLWACYCERHLAPAESPVKVHKGDEGTWRLSGDLINVCKYLKGGCKEDGARLFSVALWQDKRQWARTETQKHIRFPPTFRKLFFFFLTGTVCLERLWILPSLLEILRSCGAGQASLGVPTCADVILIVSFLARHALFELSYVWACGFAFLCHPP